MSAEHSLAHSMVRDASASWAPEESKSFAFFAAGQRYQGIGVEIESSLALRARTLTNPECIEDFRHVLVPWAACGVVPGGQSTQFAAEEASSLLE
jgi:hypothetical protein